MLSDFSKVPEFDNIIASTQETKQEDYLELRMFEAILDNTLRFCCSNKVLCFEIKSHT